MVKHFRRSLMILGDVMPVSEKRVGPDEVHEFLLLYLSSLRGNMQIKVFPRPGSGRDDLLEDGLTMGLNPQKDESLRDEDEPVCPPSQNQGGPKQDSRCSILHLPFF